MQLGIDDSIADEATIFNLFRRFTINGDIYIKRYRLSDIPTDSDEDIAKFLYDMYRHKVDIATSLQFNVFRSFLKCYFCYFLL